MYINVHPHTRILFLCRSAASCTAKNLPSTPGLNFIDMRRAFGSKISLDCVHIFLFAPSVVACSGASHKTMVIKKHSCFLFSLAGSFAECISGSNTLAICDRS